MSVTFTAVKYAAQQAIVPSELPTLPTSQSLSILTSEESVESREQHTDDSESE